MKTSEMQELLLDEKNNQVRKFRCNEIEKVRLVQISFENLFLQIIISFFGRLEKFFEIYFAFCDYEVLRKIQGLDTFNFNQCQSLFATENRGKQ